METNDIPAGAPSDWEPITDKHNLAVLGKLGEEVCELGSALFRCIIQGLDEREPKTHKINRQWVVEEIADVEALLAIAKRRLALDEAAIAERRERKIGFKEPWFEALANDANWWRYGFKKPRP